MLPQNFVRDQAGLPSVFAAFLSPAPKREQKGERLTYFRNFLAAAGAAASETGVSVLAVIGFEKVSIFLIFRI